MNSQKLLKLYGCKDDPFGPELRRALAPQKEEELEWYAEVDGFGEHVLFIQNWFARPENLEERAIIMVYGPKGCGCSSVVNYILHQFCQAARLDMHSQVSLLSVEVENDHQMVPVQQVLGQLYNFFSYSLKNKDKVDLKSKHHDLYDWYMEFVITADQPSTKNIYRHIFSKSAVLLKNRKRTPVIMLDKIHSYEQIKCSSEVFKEAPLILVTTHDRDVLRRFVTSQLHGFKVELRKLTLQDVKAFLAQRWEVFSPGGQHPFAEKGVQEVFEYFKEDQSWTFRSVVNILSWVFNEHLEDLAKNMPINEPLPISEGYMFKKAMLYMRDVGIVRDGR